MTPLLAYEMTPEMLFGFIGLGLTIIGSTITGVVFLSRRETKRAVDDVLIATEIRGLAKEVSEFKVVVEHLDGRLNDHEREIALIKQKQEAA